MAEQKRSKCKLIKTETTLEAISGNKSRDQVFREGGRRRREWRGSVLNPVKIATGYDYGASGPKHAADDS